MPSPQCRTELNFLGRDIFFSAEKVFLFTKYLPYLYN